MQVLDYAMVIFLGLLFILLFMMFKSIIVSSKGIEQKYRDAIFYVTQQENKLI